MAGESVQYHVREAQAHLAHATSHDGAVAAEEALAAVTVSCMLATTHLNVANTLLRMEDGHRAQRALLDHKGNQSAALEMIRNLMPGHGETV